MLAEVKGSHLLDQVDGQLVRLLGMRCSRLSWDPKDLYAKDAHPETHTPRHIRVQKDCGMDSGPSQLPTAPTMRLALAILSKASKMLWPQDLSKRAVRYSVRLFNHGIPAPPLDITEDIFRTQMMSIRFHASDNFSTYSVLYLLRAWRTRARDNVY